MVIVRNDSSIQNVDNINGKKIAVQLGSIADMFVSDEYVDSVIVRQKKYLAAIQDLKDSKVDCVVMDELPAKAILSENNDLKVLDEAVSEDAYGIIVDKGNKELLNIINRVIKRLRDEGMIDEFIINHSKNS